MGAAAAAALLLMAAAMLPRGHSGGLVGRDERGSCASELPGAAWQLHGGPPPPWPPLAMTPRVAAASAAALAGGALSSAVGAGRAGLFVPIFSLLLGFRLRTSAALSQAMIVGSMIPNFAFHLRRRHPALDRPLVDYEIAALVLPTLLLGISLGVASNGATPAWLMAALLTPLLLFMAQQTYKLANGICKVQKRENMIGDACQKASERVSGSTKEEADQTNMQEFTYWPSVLVLIAVWSSFLTLQLLQVYASEASLYSWTLMSLQVPISLAATLARMLRLQKRATLVPTVEPAAGIKGIGDAQWGWKQLLIVSFCGLPAGCLGAMLGLGGAIIIRPTLLQARVDSQVCSATMGLLILLSSTLALVEYAILGQLPIDYATYFLGLSFIAAMLGMFAGRRVLARLGSLSAATFMLAAIIGVGAVVIGSTSGLRQEETLESCMLANL